MHNIFNLCLRLLASILSFSEYSLHLIISSNIYQKYLSKIFLINIFIKKYLQIK